MSDTVVSLLKEKDVLIPNVLFLNYQKLEITEKELIILIYFINFGLIFNPKEIANTINYDQKEVMEIINNLSEKGIITIESRKENSKIEEFINLDNLYNKLLFIIMNKEDKKDTSIYSVFESEFARTLSPIEFELIGGWLEQGITEELIVLALKEAVYNGVSSLRYIDKILYDWGKNGIKTEADVKNRKTKFKDKKDSKKDLFEYDWLNDEE